MAGRPSTSTQQPYRLHGLLARHRIPLGDLRHVLRYSTGNRKGQPLAPSTMTHLVLHREWPRSLDQAEVQAATAQFLRARGVPEPDIHAAWEADGEPTPEAPTRRVTRPNAHPVDTTDDYNAPEPEMLSPNAREHFNITRPPFIDDVQGPDDLFLSRDQRYVRQSMYEAAKHAGLIAVIGESGSGKSTLRRDLLDRIRRDGEPISVIQIKAVDKTRVTAQHVCEAVVSDLSNEAPKLSMEAKGRQVERLLTQSARMGNRHVLVIEEAHDLTTPALKYLKRFWELEDGYRRLLGIVLIGQPELADKLDERKNYELREFIRRCEVAHLRPLDQHLEDYLTLKFKRIGMDAASIIEREAYDAMRARLVRKNPYTHSVESQCYPLIVQNMLVRCLNAAAELGLPRVNADLVARV
jgi:type II secretory pathway predicted ATPase ExeA